MSAQPGQTTTATATTTATPTIGDKWGELPNEKRRQELREQLDRWTKATAHGEQRGPFDSPDRKKLGPAMSGADVFYLAALALVGSEIEPEGSKIVIPDVDDALDRLVRALGEDRRGEGSENGGGEKNQQKVRHQLNLSSLHLEGANLHGAHLDYAVLRKAHLEGVHLPDAYLRHADLTQACLQDSSGTGVHLNRADLGKAHLEGAKLHEAFLEYADLQDAHLEGADLYKAHLDWAKLQRAVLRRTTLTKSFLAHAAMNRARLEEAHLEGAHLKDADLTEAHLEGADLEGARLEGTILNEAWLDSGTVLNGAILTTRTRLGDIHWGGVGTVNLSQINWGQMPILGDEQGVGWRSNVTEREAVVRAYRQLAAQLRAQGLNEVADRFTFRSKVRERGVLLGRFRLLQYLGSKFLALTCGYGYRPLRAFLTYLTVVGIFAVGYALLANFGLTKELFPSWDSPLVLSVTSFHGRVFFAGGLSLDDWAARLGAFEAVVGLLIEITFIATFTQRFFPR